MSDDQTLRVAIIDAPHLVRAGMSMLVDSQEDMSVVLEVGNAEEALSELGRLATKSKLVAVIGLGLPGERDSYWLMRAMREQLPTIPVLASGANTDGIVISRALFMGADGFVDKDAEPAAFIDAVRATANGDVVLTGVPETWVGRITEGVELQQLVPAPERPLTERELEVLAIASEGLTARQIGNRLGVRERTVTTHLSRIYKKLGAGSRVGAIAVAAQSGLVRVGPQ